MMKLLHDSGSTFSTFDKETVRDIKKKKGYVALDYNAELQKACEIKVNYTLPDGQVITLDQERFMCPELLFNSHLCRGFSFLDHMCTCETKDYKGFQDIIYDSKMNCKMDFRKDLYASIVLSGGNTMFEGFQERMEKEITALAPPTMKVKVIAPPNRNYAFWIGGSILASLAIFPQMVITREEFNEAGPSIVHRKCF